MRMKDMEYLEQIFQKFYEIGSAPAGGVTRLGYTPVEDEMHDTFIKLGNELGLKHETDQVGNTFMCSPSSNGNYVLIGSHLDSVIEGGRYDGVSGVIAGLLVLRWIKQENLDIPLKVAAFRCEESSNFGLCTVGSRLITDEPFDGGIEGLAGKDKKTLGSIFKERGYTLTPAKISGVKQYLEMHIEQGKVLEEEKLEIGIVTAIAGPQRYKYHLRGMADHSGATPMGMRADALCAAAEIILAIENIGQKEAVHHSVTTVGVIENSPNVLNVIPGSVSIGIDVRGVDIASLARIEEEMKKQSKAICARRNIALSREQTSTYPPVQMSENIVKGLGDTAAKLGLSYREMISGAGHDAMCFPTVCDTGMIFIPCHKGISHNKKEFAVLEHILQSAELLFAYLKEGNYDSY